MKKMSLKKKIILVLTGFVVILLLAGFINPLEITSYNVTNNKIPVDFDNYTIVQISDFHLKSFGKNEKRLINKVKKCNPDIIVFTGDMIDEYHDNIDNLTHLVKGLSDIAPIYQVTGNHEKTNMVNYSDMVNIYSEYGVTDMNDKSIELTIGNSSINLTGIDYYSSPDTWNTLPPDDSQYSILLYHNAGAFDETSKLNFDLILSGHTHGGIIRIPFVGGLINTDRSFGAKYESGVYTLNNSTLISNRGLGNAPIPRYNNPRELVKITLHSSN